MKTSIITNPLKFISNKRVLLINSLIFTVITLFLATGCTKEKQPARLVFPVLSTVSPTNITTTTATSGGNITTDGGSAITARGICWRTTANPSTAFADSISTDGVGTGQFVSNISGLIAGKTYHIRAYATNVDGTFYGQDVSFKTTSK